MPATCTLETKIISYDGKDDIGSIRDKLVPGSSPPLIKVTVSYEINCVQAGECDEWVGQRGCAWKCKDLPCGCPSPIEVELPLNSIMSDDPPKPPPPWDKLTTPPSRPDCIECLSNCTRLGMGETEAKRIACWDFCNDGPCEQYKIDEEKVVKVIEDALAVTMRAIAASDNALPCACNTDGPDAWTWWRIGIGVKGECDQLCMMAN